MRTPIKFTTLFLLLLFTSPLFSQVLLKGHVRGTGSEKSLAFATIIGPNKSGAIADIDGNFSFQVPALPCSITINLLGYQSRTLTIENADQPIDIRLTPNPNQLAEVTITPTDNPAWRIIRAASANRNITDPEKNHRFTYNSYSKMFLTAGLKGLDGEIKDPATDTAMDKDSRKFFEKSYLFFTETYSSRAYLSENQDKEVILATQVSGFKSPSFGMLASQLQSFSFYDDLISVNNKNYLSPISRNSEDHYRFELQDTAYSGNDTIFIITFDPRKGKNFDALQGKLYINTNGYAVQNVVAEPVVKVDGQLNARIQQQYKLVGGVWFPEQLNTYLSMVPSKRDKNAAVVGEMRSYISNIEIDPVIEKKQVKGISSDILKDAAKKDSAFWEQTRVLPLSEKERNTYSILDTVSKKAGLEEKFSLIGYLIDGQIPIGPVGIVLNDILKVNQVEGARLGIGLRTNDRISKYFSVGGAYAYGLKDRRSKYRGDLAVYLLADQKLTLSGLYKNDLMESGRTEFEVGKIGVNSSEQYRKVFVNRMDRIELKQVSLRSRIGNSLTLEPFYNQQLREISGYDYRYLQQVSGEVNLLRSHFLVEQLGMMIRFAPSEKFARIFNRVMSQGTGRYPIIQLQLSQSRDMEYSSLKFFRADAQLSHQIRIKLGGEFNYRINAGYIDQNAPYPFMFNPKGNSSSKGLGINSFGSFETMRFNEFFANKYASANVYYDLKSLLFKSEKFSPGIILCSSALIGNVSKENLHRNLDAKAPKNVYLESGILVNNIYRSDFTGFGIGFFYRIGQYAFPEFKNNCAFKLSLSINVD